MAKRRFGDRRDGELIRDLDPLHFIMPNIYPNRADNEAFISERLDITKTKEYIAKRNSEDPEFEYKVFHVVVAAVLKTLTLRPKLNRFIANKNIYMRNEITTSFVVKKIFSEDGEEALAIIKSDPSDTIDTIHQRIFDVVSECRSDKLDSSTESMDWFNKIPRPIAKGMLKVVTILDRYGKVPYSLIETDPNYSSAMLTNLGSLKLQSGYHHLSNWGTNSMFLVIGAMKKRPYFEDDGSYEMRDSLDIGITIDERIADGYYYSKSVRLLKTLIENPELLEKRLDEEVEY